jgi:aminopeptidase N
MFMSGQILVLDPVNAQIAAKMACNFERWKRFESKRRALMKTALERVAAVEGLSRETAGVVTKSLS